MDPITVLQGAKKVWDLAHFPRSHVARGNALH